VTPLGAYGAFKGDLILPIVAIGVALFILIIIVLAVKAALLWKVNLISSMVGGPRLRRGAPEPQVQNQEYMTQLTGIVMNALDSESCLDRIICSIGAYGSGSAWPNYVSMLESMMSEDYQHKIALVKDCADGKVKPEKFPCGRSTPKNPAAATQSATPNGSASPNASKSTGTADNTVKSNEV